MMADTNQNSHFGDIMVIDDNNADLKFMSDILTDAGYTVRPASDADIGLRSLKAKSPDLIIMDINLPGLGGVEACHILKNDAAIKDIPVLFISSHNQPEYVVEALEAGGTDFVSKPINPTEVLARIKTHLKIHRLQVELTCQTEILKQEIEDGNQTRDNLHDSEERFRAAFESAKDCVVIWDKNYDYLYANQASIDHVGATADQVVGKNIRDGLGHIPNFMNLWISRTDQVFSTKETGRYQDETIMEREQFYTDSIISPLFDSDGQVNSVCVVYRDVTDLMTVKKDLQDSYDLINRSSAVAFLWKNTEYWPVEKVTENVIKLFGHSAEDFISGKVTYEETVHPDDLIQVMKEMEKHSQSADISDFIHKPYRIISQDGKTKWVDDRTKIRRDHEGNITHFEGIVVDITEKINADENRQRLENNLYQMDKMASIGQLAAGVAHEVNNPIGYISANLRTMKQYYLELVDFLGPKGMNPPASPEEINELITDFGEAIDESLEGARRVKQIVDDMKGFSRLDTVGVELADLNKGLEVTLNIAWNQMKSNCTVEKDLKEIPLVECHSNQINQVILNLLVNAGQATEGSNGLIKIKTWADSKKVYLSIRDNGHGIPPENISRLFDAFFTTKDIGEGTGLGLSLSHDIIKKHGGDITVESEVGVGTEFVLSLPLVYSLETTMV